MVRTNADSDAADLKIMPTAKLKEDLSKAVNAKLDECAKSTDYAPEGCPFGFDLYDEDYYRNEVNPKNITVEPIKTTGDFPATVALHPEITANFFVEGEPPVRSWFAKKFYQIINKLSDTEIVDGARDFRLMSRKMTDAVLSMAEYNRFSKGIFSWVGFKTKWIDYKNVERVAGTTKWNFWGLLKYSIEGIVGFSTAPLLMAAGLGLAFCVLAFVGIIIVVVRALMFGDPTSGWPSLVCIILLCSGVQLLCTGIAGEYLAKTYLETKHRPIYIAAETEEDLDAE